MKVINLMDALRRSVKSEQSGRKQGKRIEGQKEMLFPISGKKPVKEVARKSARSAGRRKAG
jgi:DNA end-binding protein Ku